MCCEPRQLHARHPFWGQGWCCCEGGSSPFPRQFRSRKERLKWLETYRDELAEELAAVKESLEELK